jgi:hypothetical protein
MDDQVVLWLQRDAGGVERRCTVAFIDEAELELRIWRGADLVLQEQFPSEALLLDRAAVLESERLEAAR